MRYQTYLTTILFILLSLALSACSGAAASEVSRVTPLPIAVDPTITPAVASTPPPTTPPTLTPAALTMTGSTATPLPLSNDLPEGSAAAIAAATDIALKPTVENRLAFDESPVPIKFAEFYEKYDIRKGLILTDKLVSLDGQTVTMEGYMAPPLKSTLDFFVLTRVRLAFCPFCSSAADWPDDIALVYLVGDAVPVTIEPVRVTGRLEVGISHDEETGMVSLVRIYADKVEVLP